MTFFVALALAWRIFWQVARLRLEGGEIVTVTVETPMPRCCELCGTESRHSVDGTSLCLSCGVHRCVVHNARQDRVH